MGNAIYAVRMYGRYDGVGFYVSLALAAYCVAALAPRRAPRALVRLDATLGDLSYPIFLGHQAVSIAVAMLALGGARPLDTRLLLLTAPVVHGLAFLIHRRVERPIERLRARVRAVS